MSDIIVAGPLKMNLGCTVRNVEFHVPILILDPVIVNSLTSASRRIFTLIYSAVICDYAD